MAIPARQVFRAYDLLEAVPVAPRYCEACGVPYSESAGNAAFQRCSRCGHTRYRNPEPAVSVLVTRGHEFLLCRRRQSAHEGGRWCLPCGYIDWHEDFLAAARREVMEETSLEVRITGLLSVVSNFLAPHKHSLVAVLHAEPLDPAAIPTGGDDAEHAEWRDHRHGLPDMAFEADTHIIERYMANPDFRAPVEERRA